MPHQLVRRAINVTGLGTSPGSGTHANISPSGDAIFMSNSGYVPAFFKWNGSSYEQIPTGISATNYVSGVWTEDENYMIMQQNVAATAWQIWSYNKSTGAIAQVNSQSTTIIPAPTPGVLQRLGGDYFLHYRTNVAAGSVRILKLDRTTTPFSIAVVATYAITVIDDSLQGPAAVLPGKNAFIAPKRRGTAYDLALFVFNPTAGTLTVASQVDPGLTSTPRGLTVTENGLNFHANGNNTANARSGKIAADLSALTLTPTSVYPGSPTVISKGVYVSQYVFKDNGILYTQGGTPYDRYNVVASDGTISVDTDGSILNMDSAPNSFSQQTGYKVNDYSLSNPRIHVFMQFNSNVPVVTAYREVVANIQTNLFAQGVMGDAFTRTTDRSTRLFAQGVMGDAWSQYQAKENTRFSDQGPMGDAWSTTREFDTLNMIAAGVMGDSFASFLVEESTDLFALGPMGDAAFRGTSEQTMFFAQGVMGDAWAPVMVRDSVSFGDLGLMGDARSIVQVNDEYSFVGIGPVADAFAVISDENITLTAVAPMGDAFGRFSDERVSFFGLGPMGDAFTRLNVQETALFFAQGAMGDAFASFEEDSISSLLDALGPMGDAFATTTNDFIYADGFGLMGDAAVGTLVIPRGCRRRNMMVQNVL